MNEFLKFALIGVGNTIIDLSLWQLFLKLMGNRFDKLFQKLPLNKYGFAHIISALITFNFSYWMNKTFTFGSSVAFGEGFTKFLIVSLVSMLLAAKTLSFFTKTNFLRTIVPPIDFLRSRYPLFCKLVTIVIFMFVNYFSQKYLVF
jgi:putative flippase GtrA